MKYVVIGGAGSMGSVIVRDLVETISKNDEIVIADYNIEKAKELSELFPDRKIKALFVDAEQTEQTAEEIKDADIIINSAQYQYNLSLMETALLLKSHYIDLGGLFHVTKKQMELHDRFKEIGKIALIGMGSAPGISNVLAGYGAEQMDSVKEIHVRVATKDATRYSSKPVFSVSYSLKTILDEFTLEPAVFSNGRFKFLIPLSGAEPHRFPLPVGIQNPMYALHSEVATFPVAFRKKGIKDVSFKIAFSEDFSEKVKFLRDIGLASNEPIDIHGIKITPIDVINKIVMSQSMPVRIGALKQYEVIRSIVKGIRNSKKVTWIIDCHTKGKHEWDIGTDISTGSSPSIAARMILNKEIKGKGVLLPEKCVPSQRFFEELEKRDMFIKIQKKEGWSFEV